MNKALKVNPSVPVYDGRLFSWKGKVGVTSVDSLTVPVGGRVWPDSCDFGFWVRSPRTGETKLFCLEDLDGEWEFYSSSDGIRIAVAYS